MYCYCIENQFVGKNITEGLEAADTCCYWTVCQVWSVGFGTLAGDVKKVFAFSGINAELYQAAALKGMTATYMVALKVFDRQTVIDGGH